MNFKEINIGTLIENLVIELGLEMFRICKFLNCTESDVLEMYQAKSLDTEILLRWCKLIEYDFFRLYSQHLILYAPVSSTPDRRSINKKKQVLPSFRKNIYTKEIIDFIIEQIDTKKMTRNEVMEVYRIPKTTLYKWLEKYK